MHGNIWEWCNDREGHYGTKDVSDPAGPAPRPASGPDLGSSRVARIMEWFVVAQGPNAGPNEGSDRVRRGGCWKYNASYCRSAFRLGRFPDGRDYDLGFRVALSPSGQPPEAEVEKGESGVGSGGPE